MISTNLYRPLIATAALVAVVAVAVSMQTETAEAQSPTTRAWDAGEGLEGKRVTIHLRTNIIAMDNRRREESNGFARINDIPVSINGTVSAVVSEGGVGWIILSRSGGDAWVPVSEVQLITATPETP